MVEMGQIKVFVQKLGLKQGFLADTKNRHCVIASLKQNEEWILEFYKKHFYVE